MKKITPSNSLAHSVIFFPSPYQCWRWNNKIFYSTYLVPTVNFDARGSCCPQGNTFLSNKTPDGDYIWRFKSHPSQIYCFEQSRSGDSDTSSKTTGKLKKLYKKTPRVEAHVLAQFWPLPGGLYGALAVWQLTLTLNWEKHAPSPNNRRTVPEVLRFINLVHCCCLLWYLLSLILGFRREKGFKKQQAFKSALLFSFFIRTWTK